MINRLAVFSIFRSLQGESTYAGLPCCFVRLAGCRAGCVYCDTQEAAEAEGSLRTVPQILTAVEELDTAVVEVTGGEPLQQFQTHGLLKALCDAGYAVLLETNGIEDIRAVDDRVHIIMDMKTPGSGAQSALSSNVAEIKRRKGEVKFVLANKADFDYAFEISREKRLFDACDVLISAEESVSRQEVANWILESHLPFRFQLQLHKVLWPGQDDV